VVGVPNATIVPPRPVRTRFAVAAGQVASRASRLLGRGRGAVIGGRIALKLDPGTLRRLTAGRPVTIVTGTNGKTTTTRLVAEALGVAGSVSSNRGANMPPGLVEASASDADELVLEVDELWVPSVAMQVHPKVLVLLNLSRDQLDRITEVRRIADLWRDLIRSSTWPMTVVANVDDPLVVWAVGDHPDVVWVAAGSRWREDAALCPSCSRVREVADDGTWSCECGLSRPEPEWWIEGDVLHRADGLAVAMQLALPGDFNRANSAVAVAVAAARGVDPLAALVPVRQVADVSGRYVTTDLDGRRLRLLMGKNPASWTETMHLIADTASAVAICLNARVADGKDTSWIWDVPFEVLAGRTVVASGDRRLDLSVRLDVAGVAHTVVADLVESVSALPIGDVDVVATYTAFHDLLEGLHVRW
jgi:UDP-N-acetylmuramyl tripeptide synthase